jgi:hypothetical protein
MIVRFDSVARVGATSIVVLGIGGLGDTKLRGEELRVGELAIIETEEFIKRGLSYNVARALVSCWCGCT